MKAMILAAGVGNRLKPLTDAKPKALVEVGGQPMIGSLIYRLSEQGITAFIVNVHHFSAQVIDYLKSVEFKGFEIAISDESSKLLDTGGGLFKVAGFFGDEVRERSFTQPRRSVKEYMFGDMSAFFCGS